MTGFDLAIADTWDGDTVAFLLPTIPSDAPAEIREGIARRRVTAVTGECPCGAGLVLPNRAERRKAARTGEPIQMSVEHEDGCPAVDDVLIVAIREWKR